MRSALFFISLDFCSIFHSSYTNPPPVCGTRNGCYPNRPHLFRTFSSTPSFSRFSFPFAAVAACAINRSSVATRQESSQDFGMFVFWIGYPYRFLNIEICFSILILLATISINMKKTYVLGYPYTEFFRSLRYPSVEFFRSWGLQKKLPVATLTCILS